MTYVTFNPSLMSALSFLSKNLTTDIKQKRRVPSVNSLGEEITEVKQLAVAMGVSERVAAAYALESGNEELKADAVEVLAPGVYNAFEDAYEPIYHYAYDVVGREYLHECKRIRMVRTASGVRKFRQNLGSIIISEGAQPLDALKATHNDVPGYDKLVDSKGHAFYVGYEGDKWVVRSGQTRAIIFQSDDRKKGQAEALYWLNSHVGGSRKPGGTEKSLEDDVETKRDRTRMAVDRLGKQGHAFRNSNGEYSYPIADVADLKNAIQAFGRAKEEDRAKLKAYIKRRARELKHPELIPEGWKSMEEPEIKDARSLDRSPRKNWVENTGDLPRYIREIANALVRERGFTISRAIATAVARVKRWAVDPDVSADTRAKAAAAVAQWNALKAKNKARMLAKRKNG